MKTFIAVLSVGAATGCTYPLPAADQTLLNCKGNDNCPEDSACGSIWLGDTPCNLTDGFILMDGSEWTKLSAPSEAHVWYLCRLTTRLFPACYPQTEGPQCGQKKCTPGERCAVVKKETSVAATSLQMKCAPDTGSDLGTCATCPEPNCYEVLRWDSKGKREWRFCKANALP